jgi:outer membrane biosynthesis protein TonB
MSKLLENKQIIHIVTEIIAIAVIIFYFSSKNKKLLGHIEDLSQRLEDQEDIIQKHEQIIKQLVQAINNRGPITTVNIPKPPVKEKKITKKPISRPRVSFNDNEEVKENPNPKHKPKQVEPVIEKVPEKVLVQVTEESSDDSDDIDEEIAEELDELLSEQDLKKKI